MRIMVFDVPAESGGALTILRYFYNKYKIDQDNEYIFVVSKPKLQETKNIKVLNYPWIKKSWIHRLYFDYFIAPKIIKNYDIDEVFSLQNVIIPNTKIKQVVYIHNSLPFSKYRFKFLENRLLWIYQNIIGKSIFKSIKKSEKVIVQTEWMRKACIEKLKVNYDKIEVMPPKIDVKVKQYFKETKVNKSTFFYPASGVEFKNHRVIVDACSQLKKEGIDNFRIIFTLNGYENKNILKLYKKIKDENLPIEFVGMIPREKVFEYYTKSVLIFPSYIETIGMPLIEAKLHRTPILVSDCEFSHEILNKYENLYFFNPVNSAELAQLIINTIK